VTGWVIIVPLANLIYIRDQDIVSWGQLYRVMLAYWSHKDAYNARCNCTEKSVTPPSSTGIEALPASGSGQRAICNLQMAREMHKMKWYRTPVRRLNE